MPPFGRPGALPATEAATAQRLLEAAAHEFALHGYEAARVRDIVDAAGANLAAVNYHFGGKEGLYQATLGHLARQAREDSPVDSPELRALPPQDQLRAFARVMLERYLGAANPSPLSRIIAHELLDPTPALGQVVRGVTGPQWARLEEIVRAILGPAATDEDVALSALSAASQWVFFLFGRRMFELQFPALAAGPRRIDRLADHIAASAIAAMRELRRKREEASGEPAAKASKLPRGQPPKVARALKARPTGRRQK
ncbi:MAG: CerR family C-terminal domain-containing protein [Burkholderiales bacterium]|nr:CerR family C-terminal domain-containing protein [Burkholderiales bacterium]